MKDQDKDFKLDQERKSDALKGLKTHPGFKALVGVIQEMYNDAFTLLLAHECGDSRSRIKTLQELVSKIDSDILLGEVAREDLRKIDAVDQDS